MQRLLSKYGKRIAIGLIIAVSLILMISAVAMLTQYKKEVAERSTAAAQYNTQNTKQILLDSINETTAKAISAAAGIGELSDHADVIDYLNALSFKDGYKDLLFVRYFKGDTLYNSYGEECPVTNNDSSREFRKETPDKYGFIGAYEDDTVVSDGLMSVIGFYAPVADSDFVDAVVIYYTYDKIKLFFPESIKNEAAEFTVLATDYGDIIIGKSDVDYADIYDAIRMKVGNKETVNEVKELMKEGKDGTVLTQINSEDYLFSVGADSQRLKGLSVVELYKVNNLCSSSYSFVSTIIAIFILFSIIVTAIIIYLVVHHWFMKKQLFNLDTIDKDLQCFNRRGFEKEIKPIIEVNKTSYFAVIVVHIRHLKYLKDTYGESEIKSLLTYLRQISHKICSMEEMYGYEGDGQFLYLFHAKDKEALIERLKVHSFLAAKFKGSDKKLNVMLKYGIYEVDITDNVTVSQMIDFAHEANNAIVNATAENAGMQFNFYNSELRKIRLLNEDMELRMEGALASGEFQVFYQPKYNLRLHKQDGAEALVRWFDPKTGEYNRPALFMPLFESNGFIVKLDLYVYTKVCEYISYSIAKGRTVYPISVNVSRITAVQPDFIENYTKIKRKYGITDSQIMIEFTESFAYEDDEVLCKIATQLHHNGFKCSIDDFGCGYSSYRILKSLPMDEIKLDKFFIDKGNSIDRDNTILRSIISLAKELGMKVTQEGVELREDVDRLVELGCDVLQGYYYAHPLSLSDYISFVASSKEHNITKK